MLKKAGVVTGLVILGIGLVLLFAWYMPAHIKANECKKLYDTKYNESYRYWSQLKFSNARENAESDMEYSSEYANLRNAQSDRTLRLVPTLIVIVIGTIILIVNIHKYNGEKERDAQRNRLNTILVANPTIIIQKIELGHNYNLWHDGYLNADNVWQKGYYTNEWMKGPNSANGWSLIIRWISGFDKAIKYCIFHAKAVNAVGDLAYSEISGKALFDLRVIGPITRGIYQESKWEDLIYYKTSIGIRIQSIDVLFMDGSSVIIDEGSIVKRDDIPKPQDV